MYMYLPLSYCMITFLFSLPSPPPLLQEGAGGISGDRLKGGCADAERPAHQLGERPTIRQLISSLPLALVVQEN